MALHRQYQDQVKLGAWVRSAIFFIKGSMSPAMTVKEIHSSPAEAGEPVQTTTASSTLHRSDLSHVRLAFGKTFCGLIRIKQSHSF